MTSRPLKRLDHKPALRPEDLDAALAKLRLDMSQAAAQLTRDTAPADDEGEDDHEKTGNPIDVPDLSDWADAALRELLEEETYALIEPEGPRGIAEHELHQEIQKRALVGLKRRTLNSVAIRRGLIPAEKLDDLARQVAASYGWDEQEIARVVLDHAEDPLITEGGPVSRVFVLEEPLDLKTTVDRLSYVDGRYYRTDIAKWFVFESFKVADSVLRTEGRLQTYTASVDPLDDEKLISSEAKFDAQLEARAGSDVAIVHHAANATVARSAIAAFKVATLVEAKRYVPNIGIDATVRPRALHPTTEWLLDLVSRRLNGPLFRNRNAVLARFKLNQASTKEVPEGTSRRASLSAVRFEGTNLMVSTTACSLMWTEGRPMVDLTLMITPVLSEVDATIRGHLPVRVWVERDHVAVSTGLASDLSLMNEVHAAVLDQVRIAIRSVVSDESRAKIVNQIKSQVENPDPDAEDTLLVENSVAMSAAPSTVKGSDSGRGLDRLTPLEAELLSSLMSGLPIRDIARASGISEATARTRLKSIIAKLEVNSTEAAISVAEENDWHPSAF